MTKLCSVTPASDIFASLDSDMVFLQTDWCGCLMGRTAERFQELRRGKWLVLDNQHPFTKGETSATVDATRLLATAQRLQADEIIIPDVLNNWLETILSANRFFTQFHVPGNLRTMFVPQGRDRIEWLMCLKLFLQRPWSHRVGTVGVPKWLGDLRLGVVDAIPTKYDIHFLGCASGWGELKPNPRIRSWDTSWMYAAAQEHIRWANSHSNQTFRMYAHRSADSEIYLDNVKFAKALLTEEKVRDES